MVNAIFQLVSNSIYTSLAILGTGTLIAKVGVFLKTYEEEKQDSYKKAFDKTMISSIEELNFCIDSFKKIITTSSRAGYLLTDIAFGNKIIQKDKSGKLYIAEKSKMYSQYEGTIQDLNTKVKKYQEELERIKREKMNEMKNKKKMKYESDEEKNDETTDDENIQKRFNIQKDTDDEEEEFTLEQK
jgi:hypothetical protein